MSNYYNLDSIPIILDRFKIKDILISGELDLETNNVVCEYCKNYGANISSVFNDFFKENSTDNQSLNQLSNFNNYDAIFLNDDPNWFTMYNTLNLIKEHNNDFPLVFICNNIFPHKRRDSYKNPTNIPDKFRKKCTKEFNYADIPISDGFFHAVEENTPKNGVLTAIEDFLSENKSIQLMDINFINGISILYLDNSISHIRLGRLCEEIVEYSISMDDFPDDIIGNKLLMNYIAEFNSSLDDLEKIDEFKIELDKKEKIINDYKYQIKMHDDEINYKESQVDGFVSKLNLKDAQINDIKSKLFNRENEIEKLHVQINDIEPKHVQINDIEPKLIDRENEIEKLHVQINSLENLVNQKEANFKNLESELNKKSLERDDVNNQLNLIKKQYTNQLSKIDKDEYCISCFKEEIANNRLEIQYLKNDSLIKKILSPFSYVYLIIKSNPKELSLNFKLYNVIKNSNCFDVGFYLNNNKDIINSKWCKYFSPELHFVCNGFNEKRKFNKKYYNTNSKKEFLKYILHCDN